MPVLSDDLNQGLAVRVKNLTQRLADYLDEPGWEVASRRSNYWGSVRRRVDDEHYVTVHLNARYLTPSAEFRPNMHRLSVGFTYGGVIQLFSKLFAAQGDYAPFVLVNLDQVGAPKYIADDGFTSRHGTFMEFDEVVQLVNGAHEQLVASGLGAAGMRSGVEKWDHGPVRVYKLLTVDAYTGWTTEASVALAELEEITGRKGNFPSFHAALTEHLGFDPLENPEG